MFQCFKAVKPGGIGVYNAIKNLQSYLGVYIMPTRLLSPTMCIETAALGFGRRWTCRSRVSPAPRMGNLSSPLKIGLNLRPSLVLQEQFACQTAFDGDGS